MATSATIASKRLREGAERGKKLPSMVTAHIENLVPGEAFNLLRKELDRAKKTTCLMAAHQEIHSTADI